MSIIKFEFRSSSENESDGFEMFLESIPDPESMSAEELKAYRKKIEEAIDALDDQEPKNEESEEYDLWSEHHEDLEDILDDILDRLEEL